MAEKYKTKVKRTQQRRKPKDKIDKIMKMEDEEINSFLGFNLKERLNKELRKPMEKLIQSFIRFGYEIKEKEIERKSFDDGSY